jgi:hypothetical protein
MQIVRRGVRTLLVGAAGYVLAFGGAVAQTPATSPTQDRDGARGATRL